jgi:hypothetical protein
MTFRPVRLIIVPWLIPGWAQAQVWWNIILLRRGVSLTERLLAHELAHVIQWQTLGIFPFIFQYAKHLIRYGYRRHPLELAAQAAEQNDDYREWARHLIAKLS